MVATLRHNTVGFDDMIMSARDLVHEFERMQMQLHIKTTKSATKRNEALWESLTYERKNKKQDCSHRI